MSSNRPDRKRRSPQEAEAEREQERQRELAERERRRQADRAVAAERQRALVNAAPVTSDDRSDLDNIAFNLHNAYDWQGHADECVTAVVRLRDNTYRVFAQRFMNVMEDYGRQHYANHNLHFEPGGIAHLHAEMYAMWYYLTREQTPSEMIAEIGVSKPICPHCQHVLNYLGITYNARWVTAAPSKNWINPWDILTPTCKPAVQDWRKDDKDKGGPGGKGGLGAVGGPLPVGNSVAAF
jgi:hypothetical protein